MHTMRKDAEGGFNAMIENQKKVAGELVVTLVQFDDQIETVHVKRSSAGSNTTC